MGPLPAAPRPPIESKKPREECVKAPLSLRSIGVERGVFGSYHRRVFDLARGAAGPWAAPARRHHARSGGPVRAVLRELGRGESDDRYCGRPRSALSEDDPRRRAWIRRGVGRSGLAVRGVARRRRTPPRTRRASGAVSSSRSRTSRSRASPRPPNISRSGTTRSRNREIGKPANGMKPPGWNFVPTAPAPALEPAHESLGRGAAHGRAPRLDDQVDARIWEGLLLVGRLTHQVPGDDPVALHEPGQIGSGGRAGPGRIPRIARAAEASL
jgi:hypothetical protein